MKISCRRPGTELNLCECGGYEFFVDIEIDGYGGRG
jgi:hypothetical protein